MPGAASPISRSSTRATSRASSGARSATASTAATTASRSAPGTSSRASRPRPSSCARDDRRAPALAELARLDEAGFRALFAGSPIKRTGRDRFVRNVLIAIGNSGDPALAAVAEERLADTSPLVRAMAVWALAELLDRASFGRAGARHAGSEPDPAVRAEWQAARAVSPRLFVFGLGYTALALARRAPGGGLAGRRHHPERRQAGPPRGRRASRPICSSAAGRSPSPRPRSPAPATC